MRLESIKFVLPTGCWPEGSKSSGGGALFKLLHKCNVTALPQYMVKLSYCYDSVTLLLSQMQLLTLLKLICVSV
jgi:hypothetical protein